MHPAIARPNRFCFRPNIQNLNGLKSIISGIDVQDKNVTRELQKIFVPSNLPSIG